MKNIRPSSVKVNFFIIKWFLEITFSICERTLRNVVPHECIKFILYGHVHIDNFKLEYCCKNQIEMLWLFCRLLYQQKFFVFVTNKLCMNFTPEKISYLTAVGYLIEYVSEHALLLQFKKVILYIFCRLTSFFLNNKYTEKN